MLKGNVAARLGGWSVRHRRRAILGWLAFVVVAVAFGGAAGTKQLGLAETNVGEAARADRVLADAGFAQPARERVLIERERLSAPAFRGEVDDVREALAAAPGVAAAEPAALSADGRSALIGVDLRDAIDDAPERVGGVLAAVERARAAHPGVALAVAGDASVQKAVDERIGKDFSGRSCRRCRSRSRCWRSRSGRSSPRSCRCWSA